MTARDFADIKSRRMHVALSEREASFWSGRAAGVAHPFSAGEAGKGGAVGPVSNTGQKSQMAATHGAIVDFLTVVIPRARLIDHGVTRVSLLLYNVFGLSPSDVRIAEVQVKRWQFYRESAYIVDAQGEVVGRYGEGGNGDTICISLSGAACRFVKNWWTVTKKLELHHGRISRCDLAYDDYEGVFGDVRVHERAALNGAFRGNGAPPTTKFLDDHGSGKGCTLYVGQKGHKQCCIYEKGKQLGVAESPWVRFEARLYGKHQQVPREALINPMKYLRGAYGYLTTLLASVAHGAACRIELAKRTVEATGHAMKRWARRQIGPTLHVLWQAFGEKTPEFLREHVSREGLPARFKRACTAAQLPAYIRETMWPEEAQPCLS
ncbi:replication initiation factor domain-containing protein [Xanthomonas sp. XNM01]|uniref:replication initiation factor domain-containing protein n=1 Tax=Xanthomonas sp. XNM01 TaxID=2769289 RepID=UPI00177CDC68|nr:replication initiation factor domain-containing protein [Xanthomonas sp. XNM01]